MCPAYSYLTVEVSLYIQNHWAWSTPLLASNDIFWRHLKKPDSDFLCLAVSQVCKVPLSICFISGMGTPMMAQGSAERAYHWEAHLMLQLQQIGLAQLTNACWDQPERQGNTVTMAFFTLQFGWTSCWINHESTQVQFQHPTVYQTPTAWSTNTSSDCGSTKINRET